MADYKYIVKSIFNAKPKYNVSFDKANGAVNIGGVGYRGGSLSRAFKSSGSSSDILNNFFKANKNPQKTKREVEKISKGKIKVKIGKGYGNEPIVYYSLKESVNEGKDFKRVKKDKYGNHLEPQFKKGDKVTYLGNKAVITRVNRESSGVYSYDVDYYKGNGRTKASNIFNKDGKTIQIESVNERYRPNLDSKGWEAAQKVIRQLQSSVFRKLDDDELLEFRKAIADAFNLNGILK